MKRTLFLLLLPVMVSGFFSACVGADDTFGSGLIPYDQKPTVQIYSAEKIPLYTASVDSIITTSSSYTSVFGSINVPPFGMTNAYSVFRVYPISADHSFGDHPTFVSADLSLIVSGKNAKNGANILANVISPIHPRPIEEIVIPNCAVAIVLSSLLIALSAILASLLPSFSSCERRVFRAATRANSEATKKPFAKSKNATIVRFISMSDIWLTLYN